jgi:hypothetical protein
MSGCVRVCVCVCVKVRKCVGVKQMRTRVRYVGMYEERNDTPHELSTGRLVQLENRNQALLIAVHSEESSLRCRGFTFHLRWVTA